MLLAVAQIWSLPGAPESPDESHDESPDGSPNESHDEPRDESPHEPLDGSCDSHIMTHLGSTMPVFARKEKRERKGKRERDCAT